MSLFSLITLSAVIVFFSNSHALSQTNSPITSTRVTTTDFEPRERVVDMIRLKVSLKIEPFGRVVDGRITHTFRVLRRELDSIELNAVGIQFKQVTLGNVPARFRTTDTSIIVYSATKLKWDQVDSVSFTYKAVPKTGLHFTGWDDSTGTMLRQIWSQGQGIDNRHWLPMYDEMNDKVISEVILTFDSTYQVLSNGNLKSSALNSDGTRTWHYAMTKPQAPYLIMLAVGRYIVKDTAAKNGVPMHLYCYPNYESEFDHTYHGSTEMMDFLEREIGLPYPWETYSQVPVANYTFGAMENTTATVFGDFYMVDARGVLDRDYFYTNIHELTHQWFGDYVTARSKAHHWLQESFATFYPHLYSGAMYGEDQYQWSRKHLQNVALGASKLDRNPIVHTEAGYGRYYQKGAAVLDMMRYTFGAEELRRVILHYLLHHPYGNVETNDLYQSFQDTLGISPAWFFEQWLYKGGEPHYKVDYREVGASSLTGEVPSTLVSIAQIHGVDDLTGYFTMPINLHVYYINGKHDSIQVVVAGPYTTVEIPNTVGKPVSFVVFDPGSHVLKHVTFKRTPAELLAQASTATNMIDRNEALLALLERPNIDAVTVEWIEERYKEEAFAGNRMAVTSLAWQKLQPSNIAPFKILETGLADPDLRVRKHTLGLIQTVPNGLQAAVEAMLTDSSYKVISEAFNKLCTTFPERRSAYISLLSGIKSPGREIEIDILQQQYFMGQVGVADRLAELAGNQYEFIARQNAMRALERCEVLTKQTVMSIVDAIQSSNSRLSGTAYSTLESFSKSVKWQTFMKALYPQIKEKDTTGKVRKLFR